MNQEITNDMNKYVFLIQYKDGLHTIKLCSFPPISAKVTVDFSNTGPAEKLKDGLGVTF